MATVKEEEEEDSEVEVEVDVDVEVGFDLLGFGFDFFFKGFFSSFEEGFEGNRFRRALARSVALDALPVIRQIRGEPFSSCDFGSDFESSSIEDERVGSAEENGDSKRRMLEVNCVDRKENSKNVLFRLFEEWKIKRPKPAFLKVLAKIEK